MATSTKSKRKPEPRSLREIDSTIGKLQKRIPEVEAETFRLHRARKKLEVQAADALVDDDVDARKAAHGELAELRAEIATAESAVERIKAKIAELQTERRRVEGQAAVDHLAGLCRELGQRYEERVAKAMALLPEFTELLETVFWTCWRRDELTFAVRHLARHTGAEIPDLGPEVSHPEQDRRIEELVVFRAVSLFPPEQGRRIVRPGVPVRDYFPKEAQAFKHLIPADVKV